MSVSHLCSVFSLPSISCEALCPILPWCLLTWRCLRFDKQDSFMSKLRKANMKHPHCYPIILQGGWQCMCLCIHTWTCVCILVWKSVFCVMSWWSKLTLLQRQKHQPFIFYSALSVYLSIVLPQPSHLRNANQPLRLHGWQWLPRWVVALAYPAVFTDRWFNPTLLYAGNKLAIKKREFK